MTSKVLRKGAGGQQGSAADETPRTRAQDKPVIARWERILLWLWLIVNLGIGVLTVRQYGVSYDEPNNYRYAADTVAAYRSWFGILYTPAYNSSYDGHGPAFVAAVSVLLRAVQGIFPGVFLPDFWHFSYFLAFQLTGLCLYLLMRRWFSAWTAWGTLLLFSTQPLLLGYAFINPKDIPFMFFFTWSILLGLRLADGLREDPAFVSLREPFHLLADKLGQAEPGRRRQFFLLLGSALGLLLILAFASSTIHGWIDQVAKAAYRASGDSWAGHLLGVLGDHPQGVTARDYVDRAQSIFQQGGRAALVAGVLLFLIYFMASFPAISRAIWQKRIKLRELAAAAAKLPARVWSSLGMSSVKAWLAEFLQSLVQPRVIVAGIVLGFATSIRAIAPWGGAIAILYLFMQVRGRAWATAAAYFLLAGIVTYLTWPRLWGAPLQRYREGLGTISNFVSAQHVLFNGHIYPAQGLPASYIPILLNIQFTETFLACAYIGLVILAWQLLGGRVRADLVLYIAMAFAAPLIAWEVLRSPLYDNLRQLLFVSPAMFMLAALTLEQVFDFARRSWIRVAVIAALALPGIYADLTLFPYQYVYYNSLVGGLAGAYKLYPIDPWQTVTREVALELDQRAPDGAKVLSGSTSEVMGLYARPDLILEPAYDNAADLKGSYSYAINVANVKRWSLHHDTQDIFVVEREGVILGTLTAIDNSTTK